MGETFNAIKFLSLLLIIFVSFNTSYASTDNIEKARILFLEGKYLKAIEVCKSLNTLQSLILQSRITSIYTYFYIKNDLAQKEYLKSYEIAKKAIEIDSSNPESYVEAAHSLGRYGQQIGIISAISMGIADRVKNYLVTALSLDNQNVIANISIGIWHAEIINQAGKTIGRTIYGAKKNKARYYFKKAYELNNNQIGILYELAYGYYLLGEKDDTEKSKKLISKLLIMENYAHMDSLYKIKAENLKKKLKFY